MKGKNERTRISEETHFNFGIAYKTVKDYLNAFANQTGGEITFPDVADRVGLLLRAEAKKIRETLGTPEHLQQMFPNSETARLYGTGESSSALYVRTRANKTLKRYLSPEAIRRISLAQKKRWAAFRAGKKKS